MNITLKTPSTEMSFEMAQDKVTDLIHRAFLHANGQDVEPARPETAQELALLVQKPTETSSDDFAEPKASPASNKPRSKVERMFGNFKANQQEQRADETKQDEPEFYKGFLIVKCEHCGELKGFCAKSAISKYICRCGKETKLHSLKRLHLRCECGSGYNYRTNIDEKMFDFPCLACGNPVPLQLNRRGDTYVTVES